MKTAVYYNNHDVRIEERPKPKIGPDELLLKVTASGICGSDVMEWYRIKKAPVILGHEIVGVIEKVGANVKAYQKGQRVTVSHHVPCNTCRYCLRGQHTVCETLHNTNFDPGGYAQYIRVPAINVDRGTFILPDEVSDEEGVFIEPLGCVIRGLREAHFQSGETVLILGSGISGMLFLLHARSVGAGKIIMTDLHPYRIKKALELGATAAIDGRKDVVKELLKVNNGRLADLVVVCAGAPAAYKQALNCVDRSGTILCFAPTGPDEELSIPINQFWRNAIKILPSYASSPLDSDVAIELIRSKRVPVADLITHRFGLNDTAQGFKLVADAGESIKVVIDPQQ